MRSADASAGVSETGDLAFVGDLGASSSATIVPAVARVGCIAGGMTTNVADYGNGFRFMYVWKFLSDAGDEILERFFISSSHQWIGYIRRRLDK